MVLIPPGPCRIFAKVQFVILINKTLKMDVPGIQYKWSLTRKPQFHETSGGDNITYCA